MRLFAIVVALTLTACVHRIEERCADCLVLDARHPYLKPLKAGTKTLFFLIPGGLGWGWEWDDTVAKLAKTPGVDFVTFWWDPWGSLDRAAQEMRERLNTTFQQLPPSVTEVVVVAHSAGGLVGAYGVSGLHVPAGRRVKLVTIGAPFAGIMGPPMSIDDPVRSPLLMAVMGTFRNYPPPTPGIEVVEYVTSYPSDPVMQKRWGHEVAPSDVGPRGAQRIELDQKMDHNDAVSRVMDRLIEDATKTKPSPTKPPLTPTDLP